jgi:hypothetical protein
MRTSICLHTCQQELRVRDIRVKNLEGYRVRREKREEGGREEEEEKKDDDA